jgi:uncharacterized protein YdaU (DUF1376 family)
MTDTPIWMPLNVADYIKDTRHLSPAERGAYFDLLCHAWLNGGAIANDRKRVFRLTGLSPREWALSRDTLLDLFTEVEGVFRHKRVDQELAKAHKLIEQKRAAGKASGKARNERALNGCSTGASTADERQGNQLQAQGSVTNVTAAVAAVDPAKIIFSEGVALLVRSGSSEGRARSFLATLRKSAGDERLAAIVEQAVRDNVSDPFSWLKATAERAANDQGAGLSAAISQLAARKAAQAA